MEPVADCECCGQALQEGDDYQFDPEGIVWVCRACVEDEEDRLREEFGFIGAGRGDTAGVSVPETPAPTCEHRP